jgi:uncharacterized protein
MPKTNLRATVICSIFFAAPFNHNAFAQVAFWDCKPYLQRNQCPERTICSTSALARMDNRLNAAYRLIQISIPAKLEKSFRMYQRAWNAQRDLCACNIGCLQIQYQQRVTYLESLLQAPTTSPMAPAFEPKNPPLKPPTAPIAVSEACARFPFLC